MTSCELEQWIHTNKLVINPDITLVIWSKKHTAARKEVSITASGHFIKPTATEKLLGGQLHQSLDWNFHLRDYEGSLIGQLTSRINGLRRVCFHASFQTNLKVTNGVILSKITFLVTIWRGALQVQQIGQCVALGAGAGARRDCWTKLAGCLSDN